MLRQAATNTPPGREKRNTCTWAGKMGAVILAALLTVLGMAVSVFATGTGTENTIPYEYTSMTDAEGNNTAALTGYTGSEAEITIPEKILVDGTEYTVTEIRTNFLKNNTTVTKVTVPKTVTTLEQSAFEEATALQKADLSQTTISSIANNCFMNCKKLKEIELPNSINSYGGYAFSGCEALESIRVSANWSSGSGSSYFANCTNLKKVIFPESVTYSSTTGMATHFSNCPLLETFEIEKVEGKDANYEVTDDGILVSKFTGKEKTVEIVPPALKKKIVRLPEGIESVRGSAFAQSRLDMVILPSTLQSLQGNAFSSNVSLANCEHDILVCGKIVFLGNPVTLNGYYNFGGGLVYPKKIPPNPDLRIQYLPRFKEGWTDENDKIVKDYAKYIECVIPSTVWDMTADDITDQNRSGKKEEIQAALTAYEALDEEIKKELTTEFGKLNTLMDKVWQLEAAEVDKLINAIGEVTLDSGDKIDAAKKAYDALDAGARKKAAKATLDAATAKLAQLKEVDNVEKLIAAIGTVDASDASKAKIDAARDAYNKLSPELQRQVKGTDTLTKAEADYTEAKEAEEAKNDKDDNSNKEEAVQLAAPAVTVKSAGYDSVKISWKKVTGARGYYIYRSTRKNSGYKKIKTVAKSAAGSYTDKKLTTGTKYYYKVSAYSKEAEGKQSKVTAGTPVPATPKISVKNTKGKKAVVSWKKISGASGYTVYMAKSQKGKYSALKTLGKSKTSYTRTKLTKGKTYYFKTRAYTTVKGKKVYGEYSAVKQVKIKK